MTVPAQGLSGPTFVQTPGNGSAVVYYFPFLITAATDLVVGFIVAAAYTEQTSGFTVSGVGNSGGGFVTFAVAPPLNTTVDIRSQIPETQPTNFANLGPYFPENTTNAMDRATRLITDLFRVTYEFGIHGPDQEGIPWPALPNTIGRANTNLGFGPTGLPQVNLALASGTLSAGSIGAFLYPVLPAEGTNVVNPWLPYGWITRYGAATTNADNAPQINIALATGLNIVIPPGVFLVASPIVQTITGQQFDWYGTLQAASTWASAAQTPTVYNNIVNDSGISRNSGGAVNNFVFSQNGTQSIITNYSSVTIDGANLADGWQAEGQTSGGQTLFCGGPNIQHCPNALYAITCAYQGDIKVIGANGSQFNPSDPQWGTQANYTAFGLYFNRPDSYVEVGVIRYCYRKYAFGNYSGTSGLENVHPYGGTFATTLDPSPVAEVDPVDIWVAEGSSGCWARGIYLDNGHADIHSSDFQLEVVLPLQTASRATFSQDAGQVTPNLIRMYASNKGIAYDTHIKIINKYQASSNPGTGNSLPTSPIGFYPSKALTLLSLVGNGTTATATYTSPSQFAPQQNLALFLAGNTATGFNNSVTAGSFVSGTLYQITSIGTTDFTLIGAQINAVGHIFVANGVGSGTGTAAQAYLANAGGSVSAGIATVTFPCTVSGTASVLGTITRSWNSNENGLDCSSGSVVSNSANEIIEVAAGYRQIARSQSLAARVLQSNQVTLVDKYQCGNYAPTLWRYGNQSGTYPYVNLTTGYLAIIAANYPGSPYPAARFGLNATGTFMQDDGSGNWQFYTNGVLHMTIFQDGGIVLGAATGGSKGAGTINAVGYYINGTAH